MGACSVIWACAVKDLRRRMRDRAAFAMWLGIPLAIGGLLSLALGGGGDGPKPKARVLVVDRDDSFLSGALFNALNGEQAQVFEAEQVDEAAGRARILEGDASALLVIPPGFGRAVLNEEASQLELVTNPAQRILPGMVRESLEILCELAFYLHRIVGDDLKMVAAGPATGQDFFADQRVAEISVQIQHRVQRLQKTLFPPLIELDTAPSAAASDAAARPRESIGSLFFPGVLLMALFFVAQGLGDDVWREKMLGTLRRAAIAPRGATPFLVGKLLATWFLMLVIAALALALGVAAFGIQLERVVPAMLWASACGVMLTLAMMLLQSFASSQRAAHMLTNMVLFPMLMVGGSFFPLEALPRWLQQIGRRTPNGWSMVVLKSIVHGEATFASAATACGLLAAIVAALFFLCERRLTRAFARD
jgi:ABC-type multidrug transport system permease subunit